MLRASVVIGFIAVFVAITLIAGLASLLAPSVVFADDGGGDGGGGGGGGGGDGGGSGGGGPSDAWNPFAQSAPGYGRRSRRSARRACRCRSAWNCACRTRRASRARGYTYPVQARQVLPATQSRQIRTAEIVVAGLTAAELDTLRGERYVVVGERQSALLGRPVARLQLPRGTSARRALVRVRTLSPLALAARNDRYARSARTLYRAAGQPCGRACEHFKLTAWERPDRSCTSGFAIGVIDTRVDTAHPALSNAGVETFVARSADRKASTDEHGTGVVSLLVGDEAAGIAGLAPGVRVFAADAFHANGGGVGADAYDLLTAFDWLAQNSVRIVNLSFSGPDNAVLKETVERSLARGMVLVAAAGVPASGRTQGYPARYDGVVAVSSVDPRLRPSRLSTRGDHIAFTAPGVGLTVAGNGKALRKVDGTSFAAPFVTAAFARGLAARASQPDVTRLLSANAKDLGAPGRDPIFGWGLVQFSGLPRCR